MIPKHPYDEDWEGDKLKMAIFVGAFFSFITFILFTFSNLPESIKGYTFGAVIVAFLGGFMLAVHVYEEREKQVSSEEIRIRYR